MSEKETGMSVGAVATLIVAGGVALAILGAIMRSDRESSASPSNSDLISAAKEEVLSRVKDPSSVRFGDVWVGSLVTDNVPSGTRVVCGYFNARNGFGGYSGQQRFFGGVGMLMFEESHAVLINQAWQDACVSRRQR